MKNIIKTLKIISASLNSDKALDIKIINVMKKTSFTDYIVITSGTSKRHIITMAKNLKEKLVRCYSIILKKNILDYLH